MYTDFKKDIHIHIILTVCTDRGEYRFIELHRRSTELIKIKQCSYIF